MSEQDEAFKQAVGRGMAHRRAAHRKLQRAEARIKELEAKISTCPDCNMEYIDHDGVGFCGCVEAARIDRKQRERIFELEGIVAKLPEWLRKWWRFGPGQNPASSWHDREDFIAELEKLETGKPSLLDLAAEEASKQ